MKQSVLRYSEFVTPRDTARTRNMERQQRHSDESMPCRCAFGYSIDGDLRFISHHDTLRLFKRAIARAALPVRFSEGFNPQPRITLPVPRPVGVASDDETLVVAFREAVDPAEVAARLSRQMPPGLTLRSSRCVAPEERFWADTVRYRFTPDSEADDLPARAQRLLREAILEVRRADPNRPPRVVDIRPYLVALDVGAGTVGFTLRTVDGRSARPTEVVELLGFEKAACGHRLRRLEVRWRQEKRGSLHDDIRDREEETPKTKKEEDQRRNDEGAGRTGAGPAGSRG